MCGEQFGAHVVGNIGVGSPPRVRGTVEEELRKREIERITPACAGNSKSWFANGRNNKDHPRVCGEQFAAVALAASIMGSPPRVRGTVTICG